MVENLSCDERWLLKPLEADRLDEPPGVVRMDGVLVRGREKEQWLEMKVGSFFSTVADQRSKDKHQHELLKLGG